jgi:hypothetical protein
MFDADRQTDKKNLIIALRFLPKRLIMFTGDYRVIPALRPELVPYLRGILKFPGGFRCQMY